MRALVTGGAGFIGSHISDALLERGFAVRVLDNLEARVHPRGRPSYLNREIEFLEGDVRDKRMLERALAGVDIIFHAAAYQDYMCDYSKFFDSNVTGTALIFEIIPRAAASRPTVCSLVFTSRLWRRPVSLFRTPSSTPTRPQPSAT